jgi:hypothetical protein
MFTNFVDGTDIRMIDRRRPGFLLEPFDAVASLVT